MHVAAAAAAAAAGLTVNQIMTRESYSQQLKMTLGHPLTAALLLVY